MIWIDTFCTLTKSVRDESRTQCGLISPLEKSPTRQARQKGSPAGCGDVPAASAVETWRARLRHYARRKRTRNAGRLKSQIVPRARTTNPRRWAGAVSCGFSTPRRAGRLKEGHHGRATVRRLLVALGRGLEQNPRRSRYRGGAREAGSQV